MRHNRQSDLNSHIPQYHSRYIESLVSSYLGLSSLMIKIETISGICGDRDIITYMKYSINRIPSLYKHLYRSTLTPTSPLELASVYYCHSPKINMAAVHPRPLHSLGPVHPPRVEKRAIKPSLARHVNIRVKDPLDHDAPAILHEPRSYNYNESKGAAVVLISGAGGGVSGPAGIIPLYYHYCFAM